MPYPYSFIQEWWGESLSPELQQRIEAAPTNQLAIFWNDLDEVSDGISSMPPKPDGILRPALLSPWIANRRTATEASLSMALNILLYAHEIVVDSPLGDGDARDIPRETGWLLAIKPLVDTSIIQLGHIDSRSVYRSALERNAARLEGVIRQSYPEPDTLLTQHDFGYAAFEVTRIMALSDRLLDRINPLARSEIEFEILTAVLRDTWIDRTYFTLTSLARISVPHLDGKINELVTVRQSEESFAHWRDALSNAIAQLGRIPDQDDNWQQDATDIIHTELEPVRQEVARANSSSRALSALRKGTSSMLIAGAGVLAGWASGGKPLPALASSGVSTGIVTGSAYLRSLKERRANKAILDLALAFKSSE
jgi:hypothetical protein